jgi:hypothetical protein
VHSILLIQELQAIKFKHHNSNYINQIELIELLRDDCHKQAVIISVSRGDSNRCTPHTRIDIKFLLCNKADDFKWALVVVYGPAQYELKESFLAELVNMCSHERLPLLVGGDYNILRNSSEKMIVTMLDGISCLMLSLTC